MPKNKSTSKLFKVCDIVNVHRRNGGPWLEARWSVRGVQERRTLKTTCERTARARAKRLAASILSDAYTGGSRPGLGHHPVHNRHENHEGDDPVVPPMGQLIESFIMNLRAKGHAKHADTLGKYRRVLENLLANLLGDSWQRADFRSITPEATDAFVIGLRGAMKQKTAHDRLVIIKSFSRFVVNRYKLDLEPFEGLSIPKPTRSDRGAVPLDQIGKLLDAAAAQDDRLMAAVIATLALTGLRIRELIMLEARNVAYNIPEDPMDTHRCLKAGNRKGRPADFLTEIPVHPALARFLLAWETAANPAKQRERNFVDADGRPLSQHFIRSRLQSLCRTAHVPYGDKADRGIVPHSFRHSFKTFCISYGIKPAVYNYWFDHGDHIDVVERLRGSSPMDGVYYDRHAETTNPIANIKFPFEPHVTGT